MYDVIEVWCEVKSVLKRILLCIFFRMKRKGTRVSQTLLQHIVFTAGKYPPHSLHHSLHLPLAFLPSSLPLPVSLTPSFLSSPSPLTLLLSQAALRTPAIWWHNWSFLRNSCKDWKIQKRPTWWPLTCTMWGTHSPLQATSECSWQPMSISWPQLSNLGICLSKKPSQKGSAPHFPSLSPSLHC